LIFNKQLLFSTKPIFFFLILSILVLITAAIYVPYAFGLSPSTTIVFNYIKLIAVFLYFVIGNNLERLGMLNESIKWFSLGSLVIVIIAIICNLLNVQLFSSILFDNSVRFKGLMSDPNYFAILQIIAISYFLNTDSFNKVTKN